MLCKCKIAAYLQNNFLKGAMLWGNASEYTRERKCLSQSAVRLQIILRIPELPQLYSLNEKTITSIISNGDKGSVDTNSIMVRKYKKCIA